MHGRSEQLETKVVESDVYVYADLLQSRRHGRGRERDICRTYYYDYTTETARFVGNPYTREQRRSSAGEGSGVNPPPSSEGSSSENTPSVGEDVVEGVGIPSPESMEVAVEVPVVAGWENKTIGGRLSNLRKAPHALTAGFRLRANLHHEVADCATSIKGYKRLEYELALTQLSPNSIKFIIGFMLLCARLEIPAKAIVFRSLFLCRLSTIQTRWYYIFGREKMAIFKNVRNKVSHWKRQFIFVRDTRTERVSNDLEAHLSEWRSGHAYMNYPTLTPSDLELKDRITNYVKGEGLVDLEALVTPKLLALRGFVDVTNLFSEGEMTPRSSSQREQGSNSANSANSASRPQAERRVETVPIETRRRACEDFNVEDNVPLIRRRLNTGSQPGAMRPPEAPVGMQSFVPPVDRQRAKGYIQQHGSHAAMLKMMDALSYFVALFESEQAAPVQNQELADSCKRLTSDKASLEDEEELYKVKAKKETGIQAAMDEVVRTVDRTKKAEAERDSALNDLTALKRQVAVADQDLARVEEGLRRAKTQHQCCISIARAQGAEWLVGADMFQDAMAVASMNTTTEIYNDVHGKVLKHRPDFPINKLAFFEGEDLDVEGKSLAAPADTIVRLRWELNEEGVPIWPPSVLEEGEEFENLPRFDS
ncbi:hypothetical protein SLEP1_g54194 [Rubroshorea leprosula]|uniref:Uncharacterized protein n=1 Tax=Rubroshorea leprosula TaxID=152421 RepID=A0AAV5MBU0_9ROSI|nr:hypothetical protein SLEP1_g54194 [Rubroshorea leprosula]